MAGYIVNINNMQALTQIMEEGVYSTKFTMNPRAWNRAHEGTFADYLSMKQGDNIYFFHGRKIYGTGKLINIRDECSFLNFPNADLPNTNSNDLNDDVILFNSQNQTNDHRVVCTFVPDPHLFLTGVDMDDALSSNPTAFKMLRVMWKLSFIKIDDTENKAMMDILLKTNESHISAGTNTFNFSDSKHLKIHSKITPSHILNTKKILSCSARGSSIGHEMAIECAVIESISKDRQSPFGHWDYISHQVVASPFKPVDYMDKMDVFGYRYIPMFTTLSKFLVLEIKKDTVDSTVINQVMKYVDWVNKEYAFSDYAMIEAIIVAYDYSPDVLTNLNSYSTRVYTKGSRPAETHIWSSLKLFKYRFDVNSNQIDFIQFP